MAAAVTYLLTMRRDIVRKEEEIKRLWVEISQNGHTCGYVKYYGQYPQLLWCREIPCSGASTYKKYANSSQECTIPSCNNQCNIL